MNYDKTTIEENIREIINTNLGIPLEELSGNFNLSSATQYEFDSIDAYEMLADLGQVYGIDLLDNNLSSMTTLDSIRDKVIEKIEDLRENGPCVVTGLGAICSLGNDVDAIWNNILMGKTNFSTLEKKWPVDGDYTEKVALISCDEINNSEDKVIASAIKTVEEALFDSHISLSSEDASRIGVVVGTCCGDFHKLESKIAEKTLESLEDATPSKIADKIKERIGASGIGITVVNACASGVLAVEVASNLIQSKKCDIVIVCGVDIITNTTFGGFRSIHAMSKDQCKPFMYPDGISLGEGSGCLIIESSKHAFDRNAKIKSNICQCVVNNDSYHITNPNPDPSSKKFVMRDAIYGSSIRPRDIDYINAHGTGTPKNDSIELSAILQTFGGATVERNNSNSICVSSTKSMTGHCLGATGVLESIFSINSIRDNMIPPSIGDDNSLSSVDYDETGFKIDLVPNKARHQSVHYAMSNSFAFGGTNTSIIFSDKRKVQRVKMNDKKLIILGRSFVTSDTMTSEMMNSVGMSEVKLRKCDIFSRLQVVSGLDALKKSGIKVDDGNSMSIGSIVLTKTGPLSTIKEYAENVMWNGISSANAFTFPNTVYNAAQGHFMIRSGIKSYNVTLVGNDFSYINDYIDYIIHSGKVDAIVLSMTNDKVENNDVACSESVVIASEAFAEKYGLIDISDKYDVVNNDTRIFEHA